MTNLAKPVDDLRVRGYESSDYREFWATQWKQLLNGVESRMIRGLIPPTPGWFVDLGGGYGRLVPAYDRPERQIVIADYTIRLLEVAANQYRDRTNVHLVAANAYHLPFRTNVFATGISVRTFHHMSAPQRFLQELGRVIRPGSAFVVSYSNKRNPLRILRYGRRCFHHDWEEYSELLYGGHPAFVKHLASMAGLRILKQCGTGFLDQIAKGSSVVDRILGTAPPLFRPVMWCERFANATLGRLGFAPLTFAQMLKPETREQPQHTAGALEDVLQCPSCGSVALIHEDKRVTCPGCRRVYPKLGRIIDMRG